MSPSCIGWLLVIAAPQASPQTSEVSKTSEASTASQVSACSLAPLRSGRELSEAAQAALRRWVRPSDAVADQAAREFLTLYDELGQDRGLGPAVRESLRIKVRARLAQLADQIGKRIAKRCQEPFPDKRLSMPRSSPPEKVPDTLLARPTLATRPGSDHLAQMGGFGGGGARAGIRGGFAAGTAVRGRGVSLPDNAEQLVELIHRTIAPSTWDVNGGPGTIYYWRPGRALVIRQSSEVHGDVADLLEQLDRMSR